MLYTYFLLKRHGRARRLPDDATNNCGALVVREGDDDVVDDAIELALLRKSRTAATEAQPTAVACECAPSDPDIVTANALHVLPIKTTWPRAAFT